MSLSVYILSCVHFVLSIAQKWFLYLCVRRDLGVQTSKHWQANTIFFFWFTTFTHEHWFKNGSIVARDDEIKLKLFFFFESWKKKTEIYSAFWVIYVPLYDCDVTNFVLEILNVLNTSQKNSMNFWRISLVLSCLLRFFNKEMFGHLLWIHETLIKFASVEWYKTVHQLT